MEEIKHFLAHIQPRVGENAFYHVWQTVEELEQKIVKESDSLLCVSDFSKNKMWQIDGKLVVGSSVTDKEIKYYNRFFDKMVSEMQDDSNYWTNHASKV